jgi:regulator of nonsense transcripts 1
MEFDWPAGNDPLFFWHVVGTEELSSSGTSYINSMEADMILKMLNHLLLQNIKLSSIGIITPYKGQRIYLQNFLAKALKLDLDSVTSLEINSIDSFQGREKDFIILSTVRSSKTGGIGFLNNERRLNVALTRAKFGMVVLGNAVVLKQNNFWNNLLYHFSIKKLLFEGNSIDSLTQSDMTFEKKFSLERNKGNFGKKAY